MRLTNEARNVPINCAPAHACRSARTVKRGNDMVARIAMISEHASPLATIGGVDSGGQNVYVARLANQLAARGYQVDVYTRRDKETLPEVVKFINRVRVIHITAGPTHPVPKEELLPFMDEFAQRMAAFCRRQ